MVETNPGFARPVQHAPLEPGEEASIAAVCPGLGQKVEVKGRKDSVLWGPYVTMQTGWSTDPELRFAASSGGALSALLVHLLASGKIDAVLQTTAAPDNPIGNATAINREVADVRAAAGSRYAPSSPLASLQSALASGQRHAFVGKPCDAAALRAFAARDERVATAFPVILSFFCAGVPSHTGGKAVLASMGTSFDETVRFRFRGEGWPGRATATLTDGSKRSMSYNDSWGKILSKHVQHRCKICADGTGTAADLVCADAWEVDAKGYPLFEEQPGVSLIVARTPLGSQILSEAQSAGHLETRSFEVALLDTIQPGQRERRRALFARLAALRMVGRPAPNYVGLQIVAASRQNSLTRNLRNLLGTLRRALSR